MAVAGRVEGREVVFDLHQLLFRGYAVSREGKPFRLIAYLPEIPGGHQCLAMFNEVDLELHLYNADGTWTSQGLTGHDLFTVWGVQ